MEYILKRLLSKKHVSFLTKLKLLHFAFVVQIGTLR